MSRNRQIVRELRLMQLLETRNGRTLEELAAELEVTSRTIRRDLEALEEAGLPVVDNIEDDEARDRRRWRLMNWRREAA